MFNKILIPVSFSENISRLVAIAADMALQYQCQLHLLHVLPTLPVTGFPITGAYLPDLSDHEAERKELEILLQKLAHDIELVNKGNTLVSYSLLLGDWEESIIATVEVQHCDLVLIYQKKKLSYRKSLPVNPDHIASRSNIPVITVPYNRRLTGLHAIVIPITDFLPVRKLIYGVYLASTYNAQVKLLGIENDKTKGKVHYYLQKAYLLIRNNSSLKVDLDTIVSNNVAEAVNQFALLQSADLVIVNPGVQTRMPGWFSSLFGNIIQKYANPPVLTVSPF